MTDNDTVAVVGLNAPYSAEWQTMTIKLDQSTFEDLADNVGEGSQFERTYIHDNPPYVTAGPAGESSGSPGIYSLSTDSALTMSFDQDMAPYGLDTDFRVSCNDNLIPLNSFAMPFQGGTRVVWTPDLNSTTNFYGDCQVDVSWMKDAHPYLGAGDYTVANSGTQTVFSFTVVP